MDAILELLGLLVLSGVKFILAPGATLLAGYTYTETVLITSIGGCTGTVIFYFFGEFLNERIQLWINKRRKKAKEPKKFSRRNRMIVRTKITYGLIGLVIITPTFLSIPLGSIIAARFFRHHKRTLPLLMTSVVMWSVIITLVISMGLINLEK